MRCSVYGFVEPIPLPGVSPVLVSLSGRISQGRLSLMSVYRPANVRGTLLQNLENPENARH